MNFARDPTNTDEYFVTAHQIFDCCGVESASMLHVDALMDKLAPFVKTNKAEFSFLKTLLDPDQCNPEINVSNLANALHQYSESQKTKMDLDESFNLKSGQVPQDSDSGISSDGLQLLEELQTELKEKDHLNHQLRNQLDFTDRQHEETVAALTAERDSLKRHLNLLREENATLSNVRRDYDDACERLCSSGTALDDAKRELESLKRCAKMSRDLVVSLEADKLSLQELLSKSKDECHRINEMYATRQSALLEENETLRTVHADLTSRLQDQEEFMQQVIKEKVLLEMELKDMLNKSNQTNFRLDRSIDVSYTDDQMLTALDSLNADSRFSTDNCILDEDSFINALKDNQGRSTNMSLFDEIRMSFNVSRLNVTEFNLAHCNKCSPDNSIITTATQTEDNATCVNCNKYENGLINAFAQIDVRKNKLFSNCDKNENTLIKTASTQTDDKVISLVNHYCSKDLGTQTDSIDVNKNDDTIQKTDLGMQTDSANENELYCGGDNAQINKGCINVARKLDFESSIQDEPYIDENNVNNNTNDKVDIEVQTEASMQNELFVSENEVQFHDAKDNTTTGTQTVGKFIRRSPYLVKKAQKMLKLQKKREKYRSAQTQTDEIVPCFNNNNAHYVKCLECDNMNQYTIKLERDIQYANLVMKEMETKIEEYENNLTSLEALIGQGKDKNEQQQALVDNLRSKIEVLEAACESHKEAINKMVSNDTCCVQSQTEFDQSSVSSQTELPCEECVKRAVVPHRSLRRLFWEPLKCLFQMFAVVCFLGAISLLFTVSQRGRVRCDRERGATPWRWFDAQDLMDLLLRIEYTAEVPM